MKTKKGFSMDSEKYPNFVKDLGMRYPKPTSKHKAHYWRVVCRECGNEYETDRRSAIRSNFLCKSCSKRIQKTIHGDHKSRLYKIYGAMKQRCYNPNYDKYDYYGGKGIVICDEWLSDYVTFKEWALSNGYKDSLSIDRIDGDGNYDPSNCRWASNQIQHRNTTKLMGTNTSGYRGVSFHKRTNKWHARIMVNSKGISLGYYHDKIDAAKAYDDYIEAHKLEHTKNFD